MAIRLYHNSAIVNAGSVSPSIDYKRGTGIDLGPGWTMSYSAQILFGYPGLAVVIRDDGTQDIYTGSGANWTPPAGVYDTLRKCAKTTSHFLFGGHSGTGGFRGWIV
jgi:hypothetical protein